MLGTTMFSLTPRWRAGADPVTLLEQVAAAGCGPAVEVIGHQAWRGFPAMSIEDECGFRDAVERLGLVPAALGVYTDLYSRPDRPMTSDEAYAAVHGGLWRAAYEPRSVLGLAAALGYATSRG